VRVLLASLFLSLSLLAKEVPSLAAPVVDQAGLLSAQDSRQLSAVLYQIKEQSGNEIALLTVDSLEDESLEGYANKVYQAWGLGSQKQDNGVLFLIALQERRMRIEVGQGLEGVLPDIKAGRIIREVEEYFKRSDYPTGIVIGLTRIAKEIGVEIQGAPKVKNKRASKGMSSGMFIIFLIIFLLFGRRGGGGFLAGAVLGSMGSGSRYRGGGFGGGGFGGGGGSSSGGGASGGW
jgi:uncharacterized protein